MSALSKKACVPCMGGIPPLGADEVAALKTQIDDGWRVVDNHHLERAYSFADFKAALDFTNAVGELAEAEGHHPDIYLAWGKAKVTIWTHKIDGLTESDFILAAKIDQL
ncbi:MAG: 4a-hydroxytetrahydrobiopterin dehydratase [Myxococcales bacterium]|nr:4a-hydroxytetrahydrobiopterin dehydratase [Myxococcales bacterium]